MATKPNSGLNENLRGSLWMCLSMAAFAVEDSFVKFASQSLPVGQILILFGLGGAALFASYARPRGEALFRREVVSPPMLVRSVFEVTGRLFYVLAIALTPLSVATVILQATPLVVVAGAAVLFGETVGWRRWSAILIGFVGVLVILQPGTDSFSMLSLLAVAGMIGFAGRDLASRAAPAVLSTAVLGVYGFLAVSVAGILVMLWQGTELVAPDGPAMLMLMGAVLAGVAAYAGLMKAMRTGDVSAVTPFRYSRLLFGLVLGVTLFGEQLSAHMLFGSALIVASGLFILWRGAGARAAL